MELRERKGINQFRGSGSSLRAKANENFRLRLRVHFSFSPFLSFFSFPHLTSLTSHCRIERLELFDELEEWHLISAHYCMCWASKGSEFDIDKLEL